MTRPSQAMRQAMFEAEVGDDVCGEDPTVNKLEEMSAALLGKEAALFVPSGTFGNQCSIGVHTRPGDEVIVSETTHVVEHEAGASGILSGVQLRTLPPSRESYLTADEIRPRLRMGDDIHYPRSRLIILENALAEGTVMPLDAMSAVKKLAEKHGLAVHLDGARLFNAAIALRVDARSIAALCDSVTFCLSKGLGAPVGSVLCGTAAFIKDARKRRKIMGGGMRQVGVLAAPGIIALTDGVRRLHEDHENAKLLGGLLERIPGVVLDLRKVQTNMVWIHVEKPEKTEEGLVEFLQARGILTYPPTEWGIRFMTSSEVNETDVRALAKAVSEFFA